MSDPFDLKLLIFRILKEVPVARVRTAFLRKYHGRRRAFVQTDLEALLKRLPERPTVVDLGANQGWFSTKMIDIAGELHAVEPDPMVFGMLRDALDECENVTLYNMAVGPEDGEIAFYRHAEFESDPKGHSVSSSTFGSHESVDHSHRIMVPQMDICTLLEKIGKTVDLMKIDIEGAEVPVLERLLDSEWATSVSVILVETHEHVLPELVDRTEALRRRAALLDRPHIDMSWH